MAEERRVKEDTKASRETKVSGDGTELTDARENLVSPAFLAAKDLQDWTACKESMDRRETLDLMD